MLYKTLLKKIRKNHFCPFCKLNKGSLIVENKFAYLIPASAPYVKNHLLVIPKKHILAMENLKQKEKNAILELLIYGIKILKKKYPAIEIDYKEGELNSARKSIPHMHFHLIPRKRKIMISKEKRKMLTENQIKEEISNLIE